MSREIALPPLPSILSGLHEIAEGYDALICDVWGVLHNGVQAFPAPCDALRRFRGARGPVVLLSNAPRPVRDLKMQFARLGVPEDCYDAIVTSGAATRADLERRTASGEISIYHLGPERDRGIIEALPVVCSNLERAAIVLCTGLFDDDVETPSDYDELLSAMHARGLTMLCANPDLVVQRGGRLVFCAGAIAEAYAAMGGTVVYYGKPHKPIYDLTLQTMKGAKKPLAIGDGLRTDIKGANGAGIDALFVADGIHGEHVEPFTPEHLQSLFQREGVHACGAIRTLVW